MRSAMQGVLWCLLAFGVACSDSHPQQVNDSETHFLAYCEGDCGEGLSCICGVCTARCDQDDECSELPGDAQCVEAIAAACGSAAPARACDASCVKDADCASIGPEHRCDDGVCRTGQRPSPPPRDVMCGVDDEEVLGPSEQVSVDTVLPDMSAFIVVGYDGGAAFIDRAGRVMVLPTEETVPTVIWQPQAGSAPQQIMSLASDGQTLFWTAATPPPESPFPEPQFPMPPSTIERIDIDGSGHEVLTQSDTTVFYSLSVDDESIYVTDQSEAGLFRVAKDGGDPELRIEELIGRPARSGDYFYWVRDYALQRGHAETGAVETVLSMADEPRLETASEVFATDDAIMLTIGDPKLPDTEDQTIAQLDIEDGCLRFFDLPDSGISSPLRPQGDRVYWKGFTNGAFSPFTPRPGARLWRTDLATGESVELQTPELELTLTVDVLGQDADHIFVTTGTDLIRIHK